MQKIRIDPTTHPDAAQLAEALAGFRNVEFLWHTTRILIAPDGCVTVREIGEIWEQRVELDELCERLVRGE